MKVFEVVMEYCEGDSKEITTSVEYVTAEDNSLATVAARYTRHCEEYEKELKKVIEVVTIVMHIESD